IAEELGDFKRASRIKNDLIRLYIYQENFPKALKLIDEVNIEAEAKGLKIPYGMSQFYKAYIKYTRSEYQSAKAILERDSAPIFRKYGYRKGYGMANRLLACIEHKQGDDTRAIEGMSEVIAVFKEE